MLFVLIFLSSHGQTEARPSLDALDNLSADRLLGAVRLDDKRAQIPLLQNQIDEENEQNANLLKEEPEQLDLQENAHGFEGDDDMPGTENALTNSRAIRDTGNPCIAKHVFRVILNRLFRIPVCKQGCKTRIKFVIFPGGISKAIPFDCY